MKLARAPFGLALLTALTVLLPLSACGGGSHGGSAVSAFSSTSPIEAEPTEADRAAFEADPLAADVHRLATALGIDQISEERILAVARRSWSDLDAELRRRAEASPDVPLDEESIQATIESRQKALDQAIAGMLSPEQRVLFAEYGGRIDAAR